MQPGTQVLGRTPRPLFVLPSEPRVELHLLSAVPDWWLDDGREIRIEKLPTHFGEMAMTVRDTARGVEVNFTKPTRQAPARIILHPPENRTLTTPLEGVTVVTRRPQTERWDFPTVIERYRKVQGIETRRPVSSARPSSPPDRRGNRPRRGRTRSPAR